MLNLIIRIPLLCTGVVLCYAIFLYENEELKLQSKLEDWWIRLDDTSGRALSRQTVFLQAIARSTTKFLDRIFGEAAFSLSAVSASVCYSVICLLLFSALMVSILLLASPDPDFVSQQLYDLIYHIWTRRGIYIALMIISLLVVLLLAAMLTPLIFPRRRWIPGLVGTGVAAATLVFAIFARRAHAPNGLLENFLIALPVGILSQLYAIAISRRVLKRSSSASKVSFIWTLLILNGLGLVLLIAIPVILMLTMRVGLLSWVCVVNLGSGILLAGFVCLAFLMLVHRFMWPLLLRPMYLLQKLHLLQYRKACFALGLACLIASLAPSRTTLLELRDTFVRYISQ